MKGLLMFNYNEKARANAHITSENNVKGATENLEKLAVVLTGPLTLR